MSQPRLTGRRTGRGVLLLFAALALPASAASAQEAGDEPLPAHAPAIDAGTFAALAAILAPPADAGAPDAGAMAAAIGELGPAAVPVVVGLLAGEIDAPAIVPGSADRPVHPLALEQRTQVLHAALAGIPADAVLEHLSKRLEQQPETGVRLTLAGLLGRVDDPRACELLVDLIEDLQALELRPRYVQETLQSALAAHLVRSPEALETVWSSGFDAPPERLVLYARAIGATRTARGIDLLASWIDMRPEADGELLTQIGRVVGEGGLAVPPDALAAVRAKLQAPEPEVRRSAIIAAGRLRDETVFGDLVSMLEGQPELVAASARWSLQSIAGVDLGADGQAWLAWHEREVAWLTEQAPALLEDLASEVPGVVLAAVAEVLRHPLHRHVVAEALGPLTAHSDPTVARGVCVAIARLGSSRSVPWLLDALRRDDAELQSHAAAALQRLTGLDLPPEHAAWSRALSG